VRSLFFKFYRVLQKRIVPELKYSQYHYRDILKHYLRRGARWLDFGCGHQLFAPWMATEERELVSTASFVVGMDVDGPALRRHQSIGIAVEADMRGVPFRPETFDLITANMVVEHVQDPVAMLRQFYALLRPGGVFIFHTPNCRSVSSRVARVIPERLKEKLIWYFDGRRAEDVFRTYYRMNDEQTIRSLAVETGYELAECKLVSTSATLVMLGPVVILELFWIRLLDQKRLYYLRSNIIAVLQKPETQRNHAG